MGVIILWATIVVVIGMIGLFIGIGDRTIRVGVLGGLLIGCILGTLFVGIPTLILWADSINGVNSMVAYHDQNATIFREATVRLREGVPTHSEAIFLESANLEQIKAYQNFLATERNNLTRFNTRLQKYRYWEHHWTVGVFWRNTPMRIHPLGF